MLVIGHLNINSLRNKLNNLKLLIKNSLDVFMISEAKLDETFPDSQFLMDGFTHHIEWIEMQIEEVQRFMLEKIYHPDKSHLKNMMKI